MSLKIRDIEDLFKRHGNERGSMKAIMLLTETVVAQQEAILDCGRIIDMQTGIIEQMTGATEQLISSHSQVRRTLGMDIDEGGMSAEPINEIGKDDGEKH